MRRPEFADDLFGRNSLAVCNLLAAFANRNLEASPILSVKLVAVVILLDKIEATIRPP
jgi:hypothetical protein